MAAPANQNTVMERRLAGVNRREPVPETRIQYHS